MSVKFQGTDIMKSLFLTSSSIFLLWIRQSTKIRTVLGYEKFLGGHVDIQLLLTLVNMHVYVYFGCVDVWMLS